MKDTLYLFLQGAPEEVDIHKLKQEFKKLDKVADTRHVHLWPLDGESHVFTAHIMLKDAHSYQDILQLKKQIRKILEPYHFSHSTIEVDLDEEASSLLK